MLSTPPSAQIELWRQKVKDGTITTDELREAIRLLRDGRMAAGAAKPRGTRSQKSATTNAADVDTDELLKELGDL